MKPTKAPVAPTYEAPAQHARRFLAFHGERILAEIPTTLRRLSLLLLVLAITVPIFLAGLLVVLWHLAN